MVARQSVPFSAFTFGFLRLIRVQNLLIVVLTQCMARLFLLGSAPNGRLRLLLDLDFWLLSLSTVCIAAAGYIINDYFDVKIDLINKPDRVIIGRYFRRRLAIGVHQVLNVGGCLIGLYVSKWVFLADVLAASLLWYYSAQFKKQLLIGNLVISLLTALSLLVLAIYYRQGTNMVLIYALFSFGISLIREIIKDHARHSGGCPVWLPHASDCMGTATDQIFALRFIRCFRLFLVSNCQLTAQRPVNPYLFDFTLAHWLAPVPTYSGRYPTRFRLLKWFVQTNYPAGNHQYGLDVNEFIPLSATLLQS